jgi:hypothetical protein
MPVHWLYQFFPEARKVDLGRTLDPQALFVTLLERGFQVKTRRRTCDQALSLGAIRQIATERGRIPSLALISDEAYQAGIARIEEEIATRGVDTLWPSQFCVVEVETTRGTFPSRKR